MCMGNVNLNKIYGVYVIRFDMNKRNWILNFFFPFTTIILTSYSSINVRTDTREIAFVEDFCFKTFFKL